MKLRKLRLKEFRQHRDTVVEFRDGMTAIVGPNGCGKSTILEAISFALFGDKRSNKQEIRNYWAPPRTPYEVVLEFEYDGKRYEVTRHETRASLKILGEHPIVSATGLSEVTEKVCSLLSLDAGQFENSFFAKQKGLAFLAGSNRAEQISKLLGIETMKRAEEQVALQAKEKGQEVAVLEGALQNDVDLMRELNDAKTQVEADEKALAEAQDALAQALESKKAAREGAERATRWQECADRAAQALSARDALARSTPTLEEQAKKARKDLDRRRELEPKAQRSIALAEAVKRHQKAKDDAAERQLKVRSRVEAAARRDQAAKELEALPVPDIEGAIAALAEADSRVRQAEAAVREANDAWVHAKTEFAEERARLGSEAKNCRQQWQERQSLAAQGKCPTCGQPTSSATFRDELERLEAAFNAADRACKELLSKNPEAEPAALIDAKAGLDAAKAAHTAAQQRGEEVRSQGQLRDAALRRVETEDQALARLEREIDAMPNLYDAEAHQRDALEAEELEPIRREFDSLAKAEENLQATEAALADNRNDIARHTAVIDGAAKEQEPLGIADAAAAAALAALEASAMADHAKATTRVEEIGQRLARARSSQTQAQQRLENLAKQRERVAALKVEARILEHTKVQLKECREQLNREIRPELEARATRYLAQMSDGRYLSLSINEKYEAFVVDEGDRKKAVISGGEEDILALCLRLALSELIQDHLGRPHTLLILDEVFGSLDASRRQSVLNCLAGVKGRFEQILVISHVEEINQVADHCLELEFDPRSHTTRVKGTEVPSVLDLG